MASSWPVRFDSFISVFMEAPFCRFTTIWWTGHSASPSAPLVSGPRGRRKWSRSIAGSTNPKARCARAANCPDVILLRTKMPAPVGGGTIDEEDHDARLRVEHCDGHRGNGCGPG